MRSFFRRGFCVAALAVVVSIPAFAGQLDHSWELGPFVSFNVFDNDFQVDDELGFGGRAGYNFMKGHEVELTANYVEPDVDDSVRRVFGDLDVEVWTWTMGYLYNFNPKKDIVPFVTAGLGTTHVEIEDADESDTTFYMGGGVRFFTTDRFQVRVDGRYLHIDTDPSTDNWIFTGGVSWIVGGH